MTCIQPITSNDLRLEETYNSETKPIEGLILEKKKHPDAIRKEEGNM